MDINFLLEPFDMQQFKYYPAGELPLKPMFPSNPVQPVEPNSYNLASINSYFSNLSASVFDPNSPIYAWRQFPAEPKSRVTVPIDDNGATINFNQFKPSKMVDDRMDELRKDINSDWNELNEDIWVLLFFNFRLN